MWRGGFWGYVPLAVLAGLTIVAERKNPIINPSTDAPIITSFWMGFVTIGGIPTIIQERRRLAQRVAGYDDALRIGVCSGLRIRAKRMREFEEEGDEGACYAFELEEGGVVFVDGQDVNRIS